MPTSDAVEQLSLKQQIEFQISTQGPMSVATYMRLCLTHPTKGYYKKSDPLGSKGDFVTAPEISQMFGEMLGAWALMTWHGLGSPENFDLVELGPGRGTLMADALRVIAKDNAALAAINIVLLETNPVLIEQQQNALTKFNPVWIEEIEHLADRPHPKIILANEFFDALPIQQYQFENGQWRQREIGLSDGQLAFGLSPTPLPKDTLPPQLDGAINGAIWETCPLARQTMGHIGRVLNQSGGAMMILDYGYEKTQSGETFQALQDHKFADPLTHPGDADLSAHVDFEALAEAAREVGARAQYGGTQAEILRQLHIEQRAQNLCKANPDKANSIRQELSRLIDKDKMGDLFKTLFVFGTPPAPVEQDENLSNLANIAHGFFGRNGGCSPKPLATLNVSKSMGDHQENVANNRALAATTLELPPSKLAIVKQIHSAKIITIDEEFDFASSPEADGMVTKAANVALGILTADCTPVLFADAQAKIVGACHAGWQGAVSGIVTNTIEAMIKLGANRKNIHAAIGPTIWKENYEVGSVWAANFLDKHPNSKRFIAKTGPTNSEHFDLPGFVRAELETNQIANISQVGPCTYAQPNNYFSHRYATHQQQTTGRQIAIIGIKANAR